MKTPPRPSCTQHRRRRIALWALAMLSWIAGVLFAGRRLTLRHVVQRHRRVSIESLTRLVVQLLILRAQDLVPAPARKLRFSRYGRGLRRRHFIRSLVGSRLRRVLKPKDLAQRVDNLMRVLRRLDAFARRFARRRLTRLWGIAPAPMPAEALVALFAPSPALADSS